MMMINKGEHVVVRVVGFGQQGGLTALVFRGFVAIRDTIGCIGEGGASL